MAAALPSTGSKPRAPMVAPLGDGSIINTQATKSRLGLLDTAYRLQWLARRRNLAEQQISYHIQVEKQAVKRSVQTAKTRSGSIEFRANMHLNWDLLRQHRSVGEIKRRTEFVGLHTSAFRESRWPRCALH